jgi:anti-sigma-K factor RskA
MMADDCQTIEPLLAAYALDSLEGDERAQVEKHLPACAGCRALLSEYRQVSVPEAGPPPRLRESLIHSMGNPVGTSPSRAEGMRFSAWRWAVGVGVAGVLLANLVLLQQVIGLRQDQTQMQQDLGSGQMAQAIAAYPGAQSVLIEGQAAYGTIVYDPERPVVVMYTWGLKPLPPGEIYQVWLRDSADRRIQAGTFNSVGGKAFTLVVIRAPGPIQDYAGFGVTVEPEGGSPGPTGPNVLGGDF